MKNVIYYNAGAGSGKTYTLTHLLADKISKGIKPSEVILTTFTNKAADDLRSRARGVLYEKGLHEQAALLDQAAIGTVHSLGEKFIGKFWYLLGLSPNMNVMDEDATAHYINRSLAALPTAADIEMFREFRRAFDICCYDGFTPKPDNDFWKGWLREVIDKATWYRVTDMRKSADDSIARLRSLFKPDHSFSHVADEYYYIFDIVRSIDSASDAKAAKDRVTAANRFQNLRTWTFADYADLGKYIKGLPKGHAKHIDDYDNVAAELLGVWRSYEVFDAIEKVVRRIFAIAQEWLQQYNAYKAERRILDFNDMERYFVQLLQNPACVKEIKGRYKLLMVDEFQDSSPVQVDIFNRLSEMVDQSYWCGDSKQAIYGFRGADTVLTESVVGMIEDECRDNIKHLDTSYRSEPDVVNLCNSIFCKAFKDVLPQERVRLNTHRQKESCGPSLMHWSSAYSNSNYLSAIVQRIEDFALQYDIPWSDIAVLARANYELDTVAAALQNVGIPVNHTTGDLANQKEVELVKAILTLVVDPHNPLAKAQIVWLTTEGFSVASMIESRMAERQEYARYLQQREVADEPDTVERPLSWLADNPLIAKILKRRSKWQDQGVAALIESIMVELNLRAMMKSWGGSWRQREDNVYLLCSMAERYENFCRTMALGASINGFLNWLKDAESGCAGDSEGIVLSTYHRSKGLEWKNVILLSLDNDPAKEADIIKRGIFGIHEMRDIPPSRDNLFPEMSISLMPNIFTCSKSIPDDIIANIKDSSLYSKAQEKAIAESTRLMYVGMTRARDRVITYVRAPKSKNDDPMVAFSRLGIDVSLPSQEAVEADVFGVGINMAINPCPEIPPTGDDVDTDGHQPELERMDIDMSGIPDREYPDRYVSPSKAQSGVEVLVEVTARSGKRIDLRGNPEMDRVGDCLHNAYATFGDDMARNQLITDRLVKAFGFDNVLPDCLSIVQAYRWLCDRLTEKFGDAVAVHHELPFMHQAGDQIVRGSIDFIWETAEGCVLVDFKTFPGKESDVTDKEGKHYAGRYGSQFECYSNAIEASGRKVLDCYVYYPVAGLLVQLRLPKRLVPPYKDTVLHIFGIDGIDTDKVLQRVCSLCSDRDYPGEIKEFIYDPAENGSYDEDIILNNASTQGVKLTVFPGPRGHMHLELHWLGSMGDCILTWSLLQAMREQCPDCEIYLNDTYDQGQFALDEDNFDYLFVTRILNMMHIMENTSDNLRTGVNGYYREFFPPMFDDNTGRPREEQAMEAMNSFISSQWDYQNVATASSATVTAADGEEFTARILNNAEDVFVGVSQRILVFNDRLRKVKNLSSSRFIALMDGSPYFEQVDCYQFVMRKMPDNLWQQLYDDLPGDEISQ